MKKNPKLSEPIFDVVGVELLGDALESSICAILEKVIEGALIDEAYLSFAFVDDETIRDLNFRFRNKDKTTDVLSFATFEGDHVIGSEGHLGDIIISVETAKRQAEEFGHDLKDELIVLATHGLAHLLGFDHEKGEEEERLQAEWEMSTLDLAGFNPELALAARFRIEK